MPEMLSALPHIAWPAVPGPAEAGLLAGLFQLGQSQWQSPHTLLQRQFDQLRGVLRHARDTVPFYRARLAGIDLDQPLNAANWSRIPLLTRAELQRGGADLLSTQIPPSHGAVSWTQTSGSTGEPVRVAKTALTGFFWKLFNLRHHQWHCRDLRGTLAAIRFFEGDVAAPPNGSRFPGWGAATDRLFRTGPSVSLQIGADVRDQIEWLRREAPEYLLTYPSNLLALTGYCRAYGIRLPNLREVQTVGEIVTPAMRLACREVWDVPLIDMYTSQEFGYLALQCPLHEHYHVQAENVLVEVLDDAGNACAPGQTGRLVVSSLHNFALPLIRYEIGDHAEVGAPCACGRGLPVLTRILGRTRNMLVLPSGERRWPVVGFRQFREIAPIRQFQFVQVSRAELLARFVVEQPLTVDQEARLKAHIRQSLGHPFDIRCEYPASIPRGRTGKYEEFVSLLDH